MRERHARAGPPGSIRSFPFSNGNISSCHYSSTCASLPLWPARLMSEIMIEESFQQLSGKALTKATDDTISLAGESEDRRAPWPREAFFAWKPHVKIPVQKSTGRKMFPAGAELSKIAPQLQRSVSASWQDQAHAWHWAGLAGRLWAHEPMRGRLMMSILPSRAGTRRSWLGGDSTIVSVAVSFASTKAAALGLFQNPSRAETKPASPMPA